ncbi:ABC transporter substrate-binding protein [Sediminispirochaeta bajacaliforniensis]|uniref:ABC transporter substrate-binding protein n=1 Tax=Sediminispirochaeta bajacaliforniensis TaxID=148 RepID=UPI000374B771|nr:ABC transporter substrate-binding protein [Sediminispirochaeta bajacaliforniensis]
MCKRMKSFAVLVALLALISAPFVMAGGQQDSSAPAGDSGQVVVTIAAGAVGQELELTKQAAAEYTKMHPDVLVKVLDTPDLSDDRLGLYLQFFESQSSEVDLYQVDVIWPGDMAEHFEDLYQYPGMKEDAAKHFAPIVQNNTVDGKLVAMPWFTDAGLLYYRTDLLEKYGFDGPPATWKELETMAQTIQDGERAAGNADFWGYVWQGNSYEGLTCDAIEWLASNGGGTIVSPDKKITINNDEAIAALNMAKGWVGTISPKGVLSFGEEDARNVWQAGNAAFMRNWPYAYNLSTSDESAVQGKFAAAPLPAGDSGKGAAALGGWQLALSKYSNNKKVAAEVLRYMAGYDVQKMRAIEGSFNPTIKSLYQDKDVLDATPIFGTLYDVFVNATPRPSTATAPRYSETSKIFFTNVHDVLSGKKDAATAVRAMELDLKDLLDYPTGSPE